MATSTELGHLKAELSGNCGNGCIISNLISSGNLKIHDQINGESSADDDAKSTGLWLGFVDEENSFSQHEYDSCLNKAGGSPIWSDRAHLPIGRSFVCDFCQDPVQFVLQVDAPISVLDSAYYRTIFVFMCSSMSCLRRDQLEQRKRSTQEDVLRSVKVFRCKLPRENPFYSIKNQSDNKSHPAAALCSWCGTWRGDQFCSGCRKVFCSKKHKVLHGHEGDCQLSELTSESTHRVGSKTLWPEFELIIEEWREPEKTDSSDSRNSLAPFSSSTCNGSSSNSLTSDEMKGYFEVDEEKNSLASFYEAIDGYCKQVLRCWTSESKPVWRDLNGRPSATNIPRCSYCSGRMRFEFQIMPQLLTYFRIEDDVDPVDWATIAVYTCEASCDSGDVVYKEEFPWVQMDS